MYFAQHYLDCLSQASYLIGDEASGRAVVVDPRRDVDVYLADAAEHGLRIEGVLLTHFHADFLAGHLELAERTGAWIGYGTAATTDFPVRHFADHERLVLGEGPDAVALEVLHTPGHTPESISVLVYERAADERAYGVLTGDALFIGDVGRPDLLASVGVTADELGAMLHDSVQRTLMGLPDEVRVFPAHGAGSACGKNLSTEKWSTIGEQRRTNYACQPMSVERFVEIVTEGQSVAPAYFAYDAMLNRQQRETFDPSGVAELDLAGLRAAVDADPAATLLDVRLAEDFNAGHLAGSVSIPLDGRFAETAGMVLRHDEPLVVIADDAAARDEAVVRLARIGFDRVVGSLVDLDAVLPTVPADRVGHGSRLTPLALDGILAARDDVTLVDLRNAAELEQGGVPGAHHLPLAQLRDRIAELPTDAPVVVYCAGGWRSSVAASYLRSRGLTDVSDILGGFNAYQLTRTPVA
ncbi:rhodanese-like domain-containing protein [Nocardioides sp.]|uniref:rhodanese-like domain-containing protein n=1 Tax=Nocardioides sp. TaxID=35761 RepID=UPI003513D214